jgi:hypothetical protein
VARTPSARRRAGRRKETCVRDGCATQVAGFERGWGPCSASRVRVGVLPVARRSGRCCGQADAAGPKAPDPGLACGIALRGGWRAVRPGVIAAACAAARRRRASLRRSRATAMDRGGRTQGFARGASFEARWHGQLCMNGRPALERMRLDCVPGQVALTADSRTRAAQGRCTSAAVCGAGEGAGLGRRSQERAGVLRTPVPNIHKVHEPHLAPNLLHARARFATLKAYTLQTR